MEIVVRSERGFIIFPLKYEQSFYRMTEKEHKINHRNLKESRRISCSPHLLQHLLFVEFLMLAHSDWCVMIYHCSLIIIYPNAGCYHWARKTPGKLGLPTDLLSSFRNWNGESPILKGLQLWLKNSTSNFQLFQTVKNVFSF